MEGTPTMKWIPYLTMFLLMVVGLLMIFIILLQRGRGGGLAGALGGMGGTSAFGTRAGDVFTKITIGLAIVWTILAAINVWVLGMNTTLYKGGELAVPTAPALSDPEAGSGAAGGTTTDDANSAEPGKSDAQSPADSTASPATEDAAKPTPDSTPKSSAQPENPPNSSQPD
jgi:preprotein translocase subunit SecG